MLRLHLGLHDETRFDTLCGIHISLILKMKQVVAKREGRQTSQ